jgi:hypothetical protein
MDFPEDFSESRIDGYRNFSCGRLAAAARK